VTDSGRKPANPENGWEETILFDTFADGIVLMDLRGQILKANQPITRWLGFDQPGEIIGKNALDFIEPEDQPLATEQLGRLLETGNIGLVEYRAIRKDGTTFFTENVASLVQGPEGKPVAIASIVRDVTEQKEMRSRIAQADRMAGVGRLAAGIAHEINNPLAYTLANTKALAEEVPRIASALTRCCELIRERLGPEDARDALGDAYGLMEKGDLEELGTWAKEALHGARRVRDIVRDLNTFSRTGEDRAFPVDLNQVLNSCIKVVQSEIKYRARLETDLGDIPAVMANDGRLSQVFLNLLFNAAQSIREGDVQSNLIKISSREEEESLVVEVRDTGCGIQTCDLDRLFEPFYTTRPVGVGSGMGLTICRNIVESYGGEIEVRSTPGQGSCFRVRLPVVDARSEKEDERTAKPVTKLIFAGRILVVDDEPLILSLVQRILAPEHQVVALRSGKEAREILEHDRAFDLILCDLMMPDTTGMDLHREINERDPDLADRMVFLSGGVFTPRARDFIQQVPNVLLDKPFEPETLETLVANLLEQKGNREPGKKPLDPESGRK
jgi:two-component system, cell cycle sensor histidine kinase and response regulator CckA